MATSDYYGGEEGFGEPAMSSQDGDSALTMKVSDILAAHPEALGVLVEHGFTPLAQPYLRKLLAHTVTLEQALRLRPLDPAREQSLLDEIETLLAERRELQQ